jgi:hypothetical protein
METSPIRIVNAFLMRPNKEKPAPAYTLDQPLPNTPDSKIVDLLLVDGAIEVFARGADIKKGYRVTLCPPTVTLLVSAGPETYRAEFLSSLESEDSVTSVTDLEGNEWKLNSPPPEDVKSTMIITKMIYTGETVEIVVTPTPGSDLANNGLFLVFTLMPWSFVRIETEAPLNVWEATRSEFTEAMFSGDEDDEDDDDDDDGLEEQVQAAVTEGAAAAPPPPPPPPPLVNGATSSQPTTTE